MGFFGKIFDGLKKTRDTLSGAVDSIVASFTKVDEELFEELEEALIMADLGMNTSLAICDMLRKKVKEEKITDPNEVKDALRSVMADILRDSEGIKMSTKPSIIVMIGVNGAGKTTTIGKMSLRYKNEGKKVILGAADTFRAAAIEQLGVWADRADVEMIRQNEGSDPAAVVFDTISAAKSRGSDLIICDTAGRLHNKKNLMDELNKISRIIDRELPDADRETLLVLDATTGQNALNQAREFSAAAGITGIVLTKLDGTAKGGVVLAIKQELGIPVKMVGVGEGIDDLLPFDADEFVAGII
ncbi:MAG: signal recognition particle-docking protein FtsY [Clostridia bacterium]|nr:signal recognition particle-docking protein FtsY [Clostridia bacterium]